MSDLTDKMKRSFFQAVVVSILLYGCTTWMLTKQMEKKLNGNYTRMLQAILTKSWRQHPTKQQLYDHLPSITKTIQVRRTRHAGYSWRSREELISDVFLWTPKHGRAKSRRPARTYKRQLCEDTALRTCRKRWTIGRGGERGSEISVLMTRQDDIYSHPQTDCFILSELFSVARHVRRFKPGSKPVQHYVRLSLIPLIPRWLREF